MPTGINNTIVVESLRRYGQITEWETRHSCNNNNHIKILNMYDIINGVPIFCPYCQNQIVAFENMIVIDEDWFTKYNQRVQSEINKWKTKVRI